SPVSSRRSRALAGTGPEAGCVPAASQPVSSEAVASSVAPCGSLVPTVSPDASSRRASPDVATRIGGRIGCRGAAASGGAVEPRIEQASAVKANLRMMRRHGGLTGLIARGILRGGGERSQTGGGLALLRDRARIFA